ncbi:GTPase HflX [Candidatus Tiddalikarchaeum anstoanum]|nr:GTPase HflX [Candidatus Tiddalikarchaeum anstoanum]
MNVPKVESYDHYVDTAYRRTKTVDIDKTIPWNMKKYILEKERAKAFYDYLYSALTSIIEHFPQVEKLSSFYKELLDVTVNVDRYKKSLGAINWGRFMVKKLYYEFMKKKIGIEALFGRTKSSLKQIDSDFKFLDIVRKALGNFPSVKSLPTVLIAGFPNTGKTSLLARLTGSTAEVNSYPFTTKNINISYMTYGNHKIQVVDTPGLLERPLSERNVIEMKAITALKYLANLVLFLFDSSGSSGFKIEDQEKLYGEVKKLFTSKKIISVTNKCELDRSLKTDFYISCITGEGLDDLKKYLIKELLK